MILHNLVVKEGNNPKNSKKTKEKGGVIFFTPGQLIISPPKEGGRKGV
jgi:hypothetical protein